MGDIKTRFKLEGEQEYRSAMTNAANAVKVLNSEQKLAKAQFQNTGNAQKYAAQQSDILKKKIAEQQKAVDAAKKAMQQLTDKGVTPANRTFQLWQTKLNNAETELVRMQTELNSVNSSMQETAQTAETAGGAIESIGKKVSFDAVIGGIGKITDKMEAAARKAKELAGTLISTMRDAAGWADDLATQATVYGIDQDTLQRMRYTEDIIDTSVENIIKSRQKLVNNMVYGSEDAQEAFATLGVKVREIASGKYGDVEGEFRDWQDVFWETGEALLRLEDIEQANAMATKIFGRSWEQLKPLFASDWASADNYLGRSFDSAREYYDAVMESWDTVSEENVSKLTALDDAFQKLENNFTTLKETVLAQLAPGFEDLANTVSGLLSEFNEYLQTDEGQAKLEDLSKAVTDLFSGLTEVDFGTALETAKGAIDALTDGLNWIKSNWGSVKAGLEGLGVAFAALKVSEGVLTFLQLLASGKFLLGGGTAAAGAGAVAGTTAGGFLTGIGTAITSVDPTGIAALIPQVLGDQTVAGRILRDGGTFQEAAESIPGTLKASAEQAVKNWEDWGRQMYESVVDFEEKILPDAGKPIGPGQIDPGTDPLAAFIAGKNGDDSGVPVVIDPVLPAEAHTEIMDELDGEDIFFPAEPELTDDAAEKLQSEADKITLRIAADVVMASFSGGGGGGNRVNMLHANGLFNVPWDGYPAILHKGERVLTAQQNRQYTYNNNTYFGSVNLHNGLEVDALTESIDRRNRRVRGGYGAN